MKSLLLPAFVLALFLHLTSCLPTTAPLQLPLQVVDGISIKSPPESMMASTSSADGPDTEVDSLLKCPSFTVRCVRGHWPRGIVGDIGPQPFKRVGIRCNQAHQARNTRLCNFVFKEECEDQCESYGPIPF